MASRAGSSLEAAVLRVCSLTEALRAGPQAEASDVTSSQLQSALYGVHEEVSRWAPKSRGISEPAATQLLDEACNCQAATSASGVEAASGALRTIAALLGAVQPAIAPLLFSEACIRRLVGSFTATARAGSAVGAAGQSGSSGVSGGGIGGADDSGRSAAYQSALLRVIAAAAHATVGNLRYGRQSRAARVAPVREQHFAPLLAGQRVSAALLEALVSIYDDDAGVSTQRDKDPTFVALLAVEAVQAGPQSQGVAQGPRDGDPAGALAAGRAMARLIAQRLSPGAQEASGPGSNKAENVLRLVSFMCQQPGGDEAAREIGASGAALDAIAYQMAQPRLDGAVLDEAAALITISVGMGPTRLPFDSEQVPQLPNATATACAAAFSGDIGEGALRALLRAAACRDNSSATRGMYASSACSSQRHFCR